MKGITLVNLARSLWPADVWATAGLISLEKPAQLWPGQAPPSAEVSASCHGRPISRGPAQPNYSSIWATRQPESFSSSPRLPQWDQLPALPDVSSESPGQIGWWVTLLAPVAPASGELEGQGPFWKEKFAVIPAPPDESGSGFMTGQQSPGRRSVEVRDTVHLRPRVSLSSQEDWRVPVRSDPPRPPHCTSAPCRGMETHRYTQFKGSLSF